MISRLIPEPAAKDVVHKFELLAAEHNSAVWVVVSPLMWYILNSKTRPLRHNRPPGSMVVVMTC